MFNKLNGIKTHQKFNFAKTSAIFTIFSLLEQEIYGE